MRRGRVGTRRHLRRAAAGLTALLVLAAPDGRAASEGRGSGDGQAPRVGVLEVQGEGTDLDSGQLEAVTDWVREAARQALPDADVITREKVTALLRSNEKTREKCREAGNCELELGRILGADYVVTGAVNAFGDTLVLTLKMHDTAKAGAFVKGAKARAKTVEDLPGHVEEAARRLFAPLRTDAEGRVQFDPDAKELRWQGPKGPAPVVPEAAGKLEMETSGEQDPVALLFEDARTAYDGGDYDRARRLLDKARKLRDHAYLRYYQARTYAALGERERACRIWTELDASELGDRGGELRLERTLCKLPGVVLSQARRLGEPLRQGELEQKTARRVWTVLAGLERQRWAEVEPKVEALAEEDDPLGEAADRLLGALRDHLYGFDPEGSSTERAAAIYLRRAVAACRSDESEAARKQLASMDKLGHEPGPGFHQECTALTEPADEEPAGPAATVEATEEAPPAAPDGDGPASFGAWLSLGEGAVFPPSGSAVRANVATELGLALELDPGPVGFAFELAGSFGLERPNAVLLRPGGRLLTPVLDVRLAAQAMLRPETIRGLLGGLGHRFSLAEAWSLDLSAHVGVWPADDTVTTFRGTLGIRYAP